MKYIIGIDGGGTKTEATAYTVEGKEIAKGYSGFGNPLLDGEGALGNILGSIEKCIEGGNLNKEECLCIYAGLAGAEANGYKDIVKSFLEKRLGIQSTVSNDADLALAALLKTEDGILTISGTGSISYGIYKGKKARAGGWGHILGDEGSGYYIALQGFKRMVFEQEQNLAKSSLTKAFMEILQIQEVERIKDFIYSVKKAEVASFAPTVVQCAEEGDEHSIAILKNAGRDLAQITSTVYRKLGFEEQVKVGIKGSVLTNIGLIKKEFENTLKDKICKFSIIDEEVSASKGAYYLWLKSQQEI